MSVAHSITSYCPTSMTLPKEQLFKIFDSAAEILKAEQAFDSNQNAGENVSSSGTSEAGRQKAPGRANLLLQTPLPTLQALIWKAPS